MRGRSGPDEGLPEAGRISALAGRQGRYERVLDTSSQNTDSHDEM
ncbi:hypothetical protein [Escherichia coli]